MGIEDLDYDLPPERIAQRPAARREGSRLLVVERATGRLHDRRFDEIAEWLRPGDSLAVNETRVIPARLDLRRSSGGKVEILLVRPESEGLWRALARPAKKVPVGASLEIMDRDARRCSANFSRAKRSLIGETIGLLTKCTGTISRPGFFFCSIDRHRRVRSTTWLTINQFCKANVIAGSPGN